MFKLNLIPAPTVAAAQTPLSTKAHQEIARKIAEESFVLLKNKAFLPLAAGRLKTVAVIGGNANSRFCYDGGSARIKAPYEVTALEGISNYLAGRAKIIYAEGYHAPDGSNSVAGADADLAAKAVAAAKTADVVIYVGGLNHKEGFDHEGWDRRDLKLPAGQDELLQKIVRVNAKTVVVLIGGGAVEMNPGWLERAPALLYAWYPGMEGGEALARVLFGDVNPSGKLPCTFPRQLADTPAAAFGPSAYPGTNGTVVYREGLLVGYRWYDTKRIKPLFEFGYGLSYTRFKYSKLKLVPDDDSTNGARIEFELANTGGRAGAEVAEVYVQPVRPAVFRPLKELKGFKKIFLQAGKSRLFRFRWAPVRLPIMTWRKRAGLQGGVNIRFWLAALRATSAFAAGLNWQTQCSLGIRAGFQPGGCPLSGGKTANPAWAWAM